MSRPITAAKTSAFWRGTWLERSSSGSLRWVKMMMAAMGSITNTMIFSTSPESSSTSREPSVLPAKLAAAAISATCRSSAPLRKNMADAKVVPQADENLLAPYSRCTGRPVTM